MSPARPACSSRHLHMCELGDAGAWTGCSTGRASRRTLGPRELGYRRRGWQGGWTVGGALNLIPWLAVEVELGKNSTTQQVGFLDIRSEFLALLAGPRFARSLGRVRPFGWILVGAIRVDLLLTTDLPIVSNRDVRTNSMQRFNWVAGSTCACSPASRRGSRMTSGRSLQAIRFTSTGSRSEPSISSGDPTPDPWAPPRPDDARDPDPHQPGPTSRQLRPAPGLESTY